MEAAKDERLIPEWISIDNLELMRSFNKRGFRLSEDQAWKIAVRLELMLGQMYLERPRSLKEMQKDYDRFLGATFDYFLVKKDKKTYESIQNMLDRTQSMKRYAVTRDKAEEVWKIKKKKWDKLLKEIQEIDIK